MELVLRLFPGLDLLGPPSPRQASAWSAGQTPCITAALKTSTFPAAAVTGIVAGPPCQDFSKARRCKPSGHGLRMLAELLRVVDEARPEWVLIENVPQIPDVLHPDYQSPASGHCRLRVWRHAASDAGTSSSLSTCGHIIRPERERRRHRHAAILDRGNRCVVTHLCGDLPPPGFCRTCHVARMEPGGQGQGRRQRGAVVHRPRSWRSQCHNAQVRTVTIASAVAAGESRRRPSRPAPPVASGWSAGGSGPPQKSPGQSHLKRPSLRRR